MSWSRPWPSTSKWEKVKKLTVSGDRAAEEEEFVRAANFYTKAIEILYQAHDDGDEDYDDEFKVTTLYGLLYKRFLANWEENRVSKALRDFLACVSLDPSICEASSLATKIEPFDSKHPPLLLGTDDSNSDKARSMARKRDKILHELALPNVADEFCRSATLPVRSYNVVKKKGPDGPIARRTLAWMAAGHFHATWVVPHRNGDDHSAVILCRGGDRKCREWSIDMKMTSFFQEGMGGGGYDEVNAHILVSFENKSPTNDLGQELYTGDILLCKIIGAPHLGVAARWLDPRLEKDAMEVLQDFSTRLIHQFLRHQALHMPFDVAASICQNLFENSVGNGLTEEANDVATMMVDLCASKMSSAKDSSNSYSAPTSRCDSAARCLEWLGSSFREQEQIRKAAALYLLACAHATSQLIWLKCSNGAAITLMTLGHYRQAEYYYWLACRQPIGPTSSSDAGSGISNHNKEGQNLDSESRQPTWKDHETSVILCNLFYLYLKAYGQARTTENPTDRTVVKTFYALCPLLYSAGFHETHPDTVVSWMNECLINHGPKFMVLLKPKYAKKSSNAKKAIMQALFTSSSLEDYRDKLLACCSSDQEDFFENFCRSNEGRPPSSREAMGASSSATTPQPSSSQESDNVLESTSSSYHSCSHCDRVEDEVGQFPACPCGLRYYCGKRCQRIDWKQGGHKQTCPFFLNQKK